MKHFRDYFDIIPADTAELKQEVFKLRYQVYCLETGFEDASEFTDGLERDLYDERSIHYLMRHKRSDLFVATVRMVLTERESLDSLPVAKVSDDPLFLDAERFPAGRVAEVSRFAISKEFRQRAGEYPSPSASPDLSDEELQQALEKTEQERRILPHIMLGLFVAMVEISQQHGIQHWFCVMEKALVRLLTRYSLYFNPVGPVVEYHGMRQPCFANVAEFLKRVREEQPDIWDLITEEGRSLRSRA